MSNSKFFEIEMNRLKSFMNDGKAEKSVETSWEWSDLLKRPGKNAMIIGIALPALYQFCGVFAMLNYTVVIFKEAESMLEPNLVPIVVGVIQLSGSYLATILADRVGRKVFKISSIALPHNLNLLTGASPGAEHHLWTFSKKSIFDTFL